MYKILLYGYYGYKNFGDDLFEETFKLLLKKIDANYEIIVAHKTNLTHTPKVDCIFLGGGEIIAYFFMYKLFKYIDKHRLYHVPIYGSSIGFNPSIHGPIEFCDFFDKCIFRNRLENLIDNKNYFYDNDIILYNDYTEIIKNLIITPKTIGMYLIDIIKDEELSEIIKFVEYLITKEYILKFILFDCKKDMRIVSKITEKMSVNKNFKYTIINTIDVNTKIKEIYQCEKHFCMRFHAHVLCYQLKKEIISFPLPPKTKSFVENYNIAYGKNSQDFIQLFEQNKVYYKKYFFQKNTHLLITDFFSKKKKYIKDKRKTKWFQIYEMMKYTSEPKKLSNRIDKLIYYYSKSPYYTEIHNKVSKDMTHYEIIKVITDAFPKNYEFNPTIFFEDNKKYILVRQETNIVNWNRSVFSYVMVDEEQKQHPMSFLINKKYYNSIHRDNKEGIYICEDIKIFHEKINGHIIGFCNVLLTIHPQYEFKVGIVKICVSSKVIELIKLLEVPNMSREEKNWYLVNMSNKYYVIYKLFPLTIYEFDTNDYTLKNMVVIPNLNLINEKYSYLLKNLSSQYTDIIISLVWGHKEISDNVITTYVKKKEKNLHYVYYPIHIYWSEDLKNVKFDISNQIFNETFNEGTFSYLNDIKNNYMCYGISDQRYQIVHK